MGWVCVLETVLSIVLYLVIVLLILIPGFVGFICPALRSPELDVNNLAQQSEHF